MVSINRLSTESRCRNIAALVDGNSIRATVRMTGAAKNTIQKLLLEIGERSLAYQVRVLRNLPCKRIQVKQCWAFCYPTANNVTPEIVATNPAAGDVWTWAAIDADTKLIPSWIIGTRDATTAQIFVSDLADRLADRAQLTSDGLNSSLTAVARAFGCEVDHAQLQKICSKKASGLYGLAEIGRVMRQFTHLNDRFSKKIENHRAAVALHMLHHNFVRINQTLRMTPAMAAGLTDRRLEIRDIVGLLDEDKSN